MTYVDYIVKILLKRPHGTPIYTHKLAAELAKHFDLNEKDAAAATSVAVKRIMDRKMIPDLRFHQKGIYFRTVNTPFGERKIDKDKLIADKYLLPDEGYVTGLTLLHRIGLVTQMPREFTIATNRAKACVRKDKTLDVLIRPPKAKVNADNKNYLQILDALELLDKAPIDADYPYRIIADFILERKLQYKKLLFFADRYYGKNTIMQLAHTVGKDGY